jgi:hypothetical protein
MVDLVETSPYEDDCPSRAVIEGHFVGVRPQSGARFDGAIPGLSLGLYDPPPSGILISVPGEDVAGVHDASALHRWKPTSGATSTYR